MLCRQQLYSALLKTLSDSGFKAATIDVTTIARKQLLHLHFSSSACVHNVPRENRFYHNSQGKYQAEGIKKEINLLTTFCCFSE